MLEQPYGNPATRTRILDATWALVEEQGAGVTMVEAAKRAGVSRQAVYNHFSDRSGLMVALLQHMDRTLDLATHIQSVWNASSGAKALEEMVALHASYTPRIIGVAKMIDGARHTDPAAAEAWDNRMNGRMKSHLRIARWIAKDGDLAPGWTVKAAAGLIHMTTLPRSWEELVARQGWSTEQFRRRITAMLSDALITADSNG